MYNKFKKVYALFKQFGLAFTIKYCIYRLSKNDKKYLALLCEYLQKFLEPTINKYKSLNFSVNNTEKNGRTPIWVCWFQGEENMPELCQVCYNQLKKVLPECSELHLITLANYEQYVEKVERGIITYTHFSDILRWALLEKWGGLWIDSTVFCSKDISNEFLLKPEFWSVKLNEIYDTACFGQVVSNCQWSGFLLKSQPNSILVRFVLESTLLYWEKHNIIIDYFIENLIIKIAYENINSIKEIIDNIIPNNDKIYNLHNLMDKKFDNEIYCGLIKNTTFFKLTWKKKYSKNTDKGDSTFYGYMLKKIAE